MTIWEYKLERFDLMANGGYADVETSLNRLGEQGWEVVGVHEITNLPFLVLKRPAEIAEGA